eukprot:Sspe_Gene.20128::Locus_7377_Transcript_1_1_Confidence_1.000_Length_1176::g.20128::m.20128
MNLNININLGDKKNGPGVTVTPGGGPAQGPPSLPPYRSASRSPVDLADSPQREASRPQLQYQSSTLRSPQNSITPYTSQQQHLQQQQPVVEYQLRDLYDKFMLYQCKLKELQAELSDKNVLLAQKDDEARCKEQSLAMLTQSLRHREAECAARDEENAQLRKEIASLRSSLQNQIAITRQLEQMQGIRQQQASNSQEQVRAQLDEMYEAQRLQMEKIREQAIAQQSAREQLMAQQVAVMQELANRSLPPDQIRMLQHLLQQMQDKRGSGREETRRSSVDSRRLSDATHLSHPAPASKPNTAIEVPCAEVDMADLSARGSLGRPPSGASPPQSARSSRVIRPCDKVNTAIAVPGEGEFDISVFSVGSRTA